MSELVAYQAASLTDRMNYAQTLAHAGDLIPRGLRDNTGNPSPGKILLVMETGAMLGLNPMAALQGIDVIEGKATLSPQLMTALVRGAGHSIMIEKTGSVSGGDLEVTAKLKRVDDGEEYVSIWSPQRALRAGLINSYQQTPQGWELRARAAKSGKILPWEAHTENMCQWRAVGDVCRIGADDVLKGIAYTREEIESEVSIVPDPEPEPTEDWEALFEAADTVDALNEIAVRLKDSGEATDTLRAKFAARLGALQREETVEEVTEDDGAESGGENSGSDGELSAGESGGDGAVDPSSE